MCLQFIKFLLLPWDGMPDSTHLGVPRLFFRILDACASEDSALSGEVVLSEIDRMERLFVMPLWRLIWLFIAILVISVTSGCEPTQPSQRPPASVSRTDSAGISIVTTPAGEALAPLGWTVDSVPSAVIGAGIAEGDQLYRVQGIRGLDDGRILIVDGGSRQLRFYDSQGRLTHRVGRRGEGPGEFQDPILVPLIGVDSLLVWDRYLQRFQYFSDDGDSNHTFLLNEPWPAGGRPPYGVVGNAMLLDEQESAWMVPASQQTQGPKDTDFTLLWYDPSSGSRVPIASQVVTHDFVLVRPDRPPVRDRIPFTVFPAAVVTIDGGFFTLGTSFEIKDFALNGEVRRIFRVDLPNRQVTDEIKEAWRELKLSAVDGGTGFYREFLSSMPIPDTLPAFETLLTDRLGYVWAQVYDWDRDAARRWVVFDDSGAALGTVQVPPGLQVEWVGSDAILGVWKDESDVEYVHRYRLTRK